MTTKSNTRVVPLNQWTPDQIRACFASDRRAYILFKWYNEWCFFNSWPSSIDKGYFYTNLYIGTYMVDSAIVRDGNPFEDVKTCKMSVSEFSIERTSIKCKMRFAHRTWEFSILYSQIAVILEKIPGK